MITLYGMSHTRSIRAAWALEEAEAEWNFQHVDLRAGEARRPPFSALSPAGKVPLLVDGRLVLSESAAIVAWIGEKFPASALTPPGGTLEHAHFWQWCCFVISELEQPLWTIARHGSILPEARRVPSIMETARWEFERPAAVLDGVLGEHPYILGEHFSGADILIAHTLAWARDANVALSPVLDDYADRMMSRPALARAQARHDAPPNGD